MSFFFLHLPYLQIVHQGSQGVSHPLGGPSNQPIHLPTYPPINGHRPGPRTYISVSLLPSEAQNNPPTQNHHQFPNTSPHNHPPPGTSTNTNSNNDYTNRLRRHLPHHHLYPSRPLPPNLPLQLLPPLRLARPQRRVDRPVPRRRRHPPRTKDGAGTGR